MAETRTNVVLNDELMAEAMTRTGLKTKRAVLEEALRRLLRTNRYHGLLELEGKLHWDVDRDEMRWGRFANGDR